MGIFKKFFDKIKYTFKKNELDEDFYDELESVLVSSDMGVETALDIMDELRDTCKKKLMKDVDSAQRELRQILISRLNVEEIKFDYPLIITVVGVNGVGKTTSIAKMTKYFIKNKKSVLLAAGDTFRAAAADQLTEWSKRAGVRIVKYSEGADPGAVVYDGLESATAKKDDVVLIDTAGRLQNKSNLFHH